MPCLIQSYLKQIKEKRKKVLPAYMISALFPEYVPPSNTFGKITVKNRYISLGPCVLETSFLPFQTIVDRDRTVSHVLNPAHVHFNR